MSLEKSLETCEYKDLCAGNTCGYLTAPEQPQYISCKYLRGETCNYSQQVQVVISRYK